jgi:hypothetical protein
MPQSGDQDVSRLGQFIAFVDRQLLPRTVSPATVRLRSGGIEHRTSVRFDPVERAILATSFDDRPLEPNVVYRFTVDGVRDLDDRQIETEYVARFRTGADVGRGRPHLRGALRDRRLSRRRWRALRSRSVLARGDSGDGHRAALAARWRGDERGEQREHLPRSAFDHRRDRRRGSTRREPAHLQGAR